MPRTLRIRSADDDVKFVQERLNSRPPTAVPLLALDGKYDAAGDWSRLDELVAYWNVARSGEH